MIVVALGGALGAIARYWLSHLLNSRWSLSFPLGTFVINVTGSFIIGFFLIFADERFKLHPHWRLLIAVGFVGGYTTFSTFAFENLKLIEAGDFFSAMLNIILSLVVGFIAVWLGAILARQF